MRESLPGVSTRLRACPSSTVQVTTSTLARGSGPLPLPFGFGPVCGASPFGQAMSVKRDSPVEVEKAMNSRPSLDSESKSMISRRKSSVVTFADFFTAPLATRFTTKVSGGGGVVIGSKPRFLSTHLRSARIALSPPN